MKDMSRNLKHRHFYFSSVCHCNFSFRAGIWQRELLMKFVKHSIRYVNALTFVTL